MRWVDALKLYNQGKGGWCIPRKGTKEYDEVRKLMGVKAEKGLRKEDKPKHLKEDVLAQLRQVASDAKNRNADKAKKLLKEMMKKRGTPRIDAIRATNNWDGPVPKNIAKAYNCFTVDEVKKALIKCGISEERAKKEAQSYAYKLPGPGDDYGKYLKIYKAPKNTMIREAKLKSEFEEGMDALEAQMYDYAND